MDRPCSKEQGPSRPAPSRPLSRTNRDEAGFFSSPSRFVPPEKYLLRTPKIETNEPNERNPNSKFFWVGWGVAVSPPSHSNGGDPLPLPPAGTPRPRFSPPMPAQTIRLT